MKITPAFVAAALLGCGAVSAADAPAAPTATPVKHVSLKACNKQADAKSLKGKERSAFVKDCRAGKSAS